MNASAMSAGGDIATTLAIKLRAENGPAFAEVVTRDSRMRAIFDVIERVADTDATVLLQGESGTGKELLARAIHRSSHRCTERFVPINCGAVPEALLEAELFGYEAGAFTGALHRRVGKFEYANGGTLFLDEVGTLPLGMQVKLLRVLQEHEVERVGGNEKVRVDVRVLASTNMDLRVEMEAGRFRDDLFYRLNVIPIVVPPLRERRGDVALLAHTLVEQFAREMEVSRKVIPPNVLEVLEAYSWPGNVRELRNVIERAVLLSQGNNLQLSDLDPAVRPQVQWKPDVDLNLPYKEFRAQAMNQLEKQYWLGLLEQCGGVVRKASQRAGVSSRAVYFSLRRLGIDPNQFRTGRSSSHVKRDFAPVVHA